MKTAILTFQNSDNFGALLQAYALQSVIEKLGQECTILDYHSPNKDYRLLAFKPNLSLRSNLVNIYLLPVKLKKRKDANQFRKKYLNISKKKYNTSSALHEDIRLWDKFIAGSDQIWNYENTKFDKTYFLDFVSDNKYSYAASFGVSEIPDSLQDGIDGYLPKKYPLNKEYAKLLGEFDGISVREEEGKGIVQELLNKNADVVLDPTLLLDNNDWETIIGLRSHDNPYILVYSLFNSESMYKKIYKLSKEKGIPVKLIYGNGKKVKKYGFEIVRPNVIDFVKLYQNATLIITDSFHGTVFSINFRNNFFAYDAGANNFSRISSILKKLGLQNRIISDQSSISIEENISYDSVHQKLEVERQNSLNFLKKILSN